MFWWHHEVGQLLHRFSVCASTFRSAFFLILCFKLTIMCVSLWKDIRKQWQTWDCFQGGLHHFKEVVHYRANMKYWMSNPPWTPCFLRNNIPYTLIQNGEQPQNTGRKIFSPPSKSTIFVQSETTVVRHNASFIYISSVCLHWRVNMWTSMPRFACFCLVPFDCMLAILDFGVCPSQMLKNDVRIM